MYGAGDPLGVSQKVVVRDQPSQRFGKPLKEERGEQALSTKKGKQQGSGSALGEEEKEEAEEKAKRKQRRQCILNPDCREESTTGEFGGGSGRCSQFVTSCLPISSSSLSFLPPMYDIYIRRHGDRTGIVHADPSVVLELGGHSRYKISIWANMIYQLGRIVYHSFLSVSCCPCPSTAADPPGPPMSPCAWVAGKKTNRSPFFSLSVDGKFPGVPDGRRDGRSLFFSSLPCTVPTLPLFPLSCLSEFATGRDPGPPKKTLYPKWHPPESLVAWLGTFKTRHHTCA
ncbi:hypothetical protein BJ166DRAFT_322386 [Pestalotiopsis sp. NC0098]|nr:hypothetical protein BJ166DRAFT_322386 [Pestalotiopsis sp. NC0098]